MDSIIITGANSGLGKETARQLGLNPEIKKIYLFCRNYKNAINAKNYLEVSTGRKIFKVVPIDLCDFKSIKHSIKKLDGFVDALIMNAGCDDKDKENKITETGVTHLIASNLIGHAMLLRELLKKNLIKKTVLYSSSEIIRGVPVLMLKKPRFKKFSVEEFKAICNGSNLKTDNNNQDAYSCAKYLATLWMSSISRKFKNIRFVSVSPGTTYGTKISKKPLSIKKFIFCKILLSLNLMHKLDIGAKRYIDVLFNKSFRSGFFYGSPPGRSTGILVEQNKFYENLNNKKHQDNAETVVNFFIN